MLYQLEEYQQILETHYQSVLLDQEALELQDPVPEEIQVFI